jgi:hypothetical protein
MLGCRSRSFWKPGAIASARGCQTAADRSDQADRRARVGRHSDRCVLSRTIAGTVSDVPVSRLVPSVDRLIGGDKPMCLTPAARKGGRRLGFSLAVSSLLDDGYLRRAQSARPTTPPTRRWIKLPAVPRAPERMRSAIRPNSPFLLTRKFPKKGINPTIAHVRCRKRIVAPAGLASCPSERTPKDALLDLLGYIGSVVRVSDHRLPNRHHLGSHGVECVTHHIRPPTFEILLCRCSDGADPAFGVC